MNRPISPPPTKRPKLSPTAQTPKLHLPSSPSAPNTDASILRIYSWNINGITPFLQTQKPITSFFTPSSTSNKATNQNSPPHPSLREFLRRHNWPQVLCLQEVKIAHSNLKTQNLVRVAVNPSKDEDTHEPRYEVFFTLPTDKLNARGPGGNGKICGVCTIICSDFFRSSVTNIHSVPWDNEGRISIIEISTPIPIQQDKKARQRNQDTESTPNLQEPETADPGPQCQKLAIWNIYAVNGTSNLWRDEKTGEVLGTRHDKKLDVQKRTMQECLKMQGEGYKILIIGDLNIAPQKIDGYPNLRTYPPQHSINRSDFNTKFLDAENQEGLGGVDVFRYLRGEERRYTYFPRGVEWGASCDRVDLAVASREMVEDDEIVGVEIWDSVVERGPSDHVPISVDIRLGKT